MLFSICAKIERSGICFGCRFLCDIRRNISRLRKKQSIASDALRKMEGKYIEDLAHICAIC